MKRRDFLRAGVAGAAYVAMPYPPLEVRDRHTGLEACFPEQLLRPRSVDEVRQMVATANGAVCVAGRMHSGGGQNLLSSSTMLDMTGLERVLDVTDGVLRVEAGAQWPAVLSFLRRESPKWTIAQKQSVARVTVGGSVAANAHGNGLGMAPMSTDVASLRVVDARGALVECLPDSEWFRAVVGGYGLVGVVTEVALHLQPRYKARVLAEFVPLEGMAEAMQRLRDEGARYATGELDCSTLNRGLLVYWTPDEGPPAAPFREDARAWVQMVRLLHQDRAAGYASLCKAYLDTAGQTWWIDDLLMSEGYVDGYHASVGPGADPIVEFLVPPQQLAPFVQRIRQRVLPSVLLASVRLVGADDRTLLSYVPEEMTAVAMMLHAERPAELREVLVRCLDEARALGGTHHPAFGNLGKPLGWEAFAEVKRSLDPELRFQSAWWRALA